MFDSCSAYQSCPEVLFLSQCVPNPPDKGERIRGFHLLSHLAGRYRVHLVCFARHAAELENALVLQDRCASVYVELLPLRRYARRRRDEFCSGKVAGGVVLFKQPDGAPY